MRPGKRKLLDKTKLLEDLTISSNASSQHPRAGGAPVPRDQAPVLARQSALPRVEEEHGAAGHAGCAIQPVDGAAAFDGSAGMSAPAVCQWACTPAETGQRPASELPELANRLGHPAPSHREYDGTSHLYPPDS